MPETNCYSYDYFDKDFNVTLDCMKTVCVLKAKKLLNNENNIPDNKKDWFDSLLCNMFLIIRNLEFLEFLMSQDCTQKGNYTYEDKKLINEKKKELKEILKKYKITNKE